MIITISPRKFAKALMMVIGLLVALHIIQASFYLFAGFNYIGYLDVERNLPTFYSSLAIEFCALLLFIIFIHEKQQKSREKWRWLGIAVLFAFLGLDQGTKVHENLGDLMESMINATGLLYFPWVVPYGAALIALAIIYGPWFFDCLRQPARAFL